MDIMQIGAVTTVITAAVSAAKPQLAKLLGVREHRYYQEEREWKNKWSKGIISREKQREKVTSKHLW